MSVDYSRRNLLQLFLGAVLVPAFARPSFADNDGGSGGNSGSSNSGSGSDNSGSGNGGDDNEKNENESEAEDSNESISNEQKTIQNASKDGFTAPLGKLIKHLNKNYPGEILNVGLKQKSGVYFYTIKILTAEGQIVKLKLNAKTLAKI
jgi:hypothetical protein